MQLLGRGDFGAVRSHGAALSACATAKRWQDSRGFVLQKSGTPLSSPPDSGTKTRFFFCVYG